MDLIDAAENGNIQRVRELLDSGIDPNTKNEKDDTALIEASYNSYIEIAELLLSAGADPNIRNDNGYTALSVATENLNLDFFDSFFPSDSIFRQNMINAFSFQVESDTSGVGYFFQALLHESGNQSFNNIQKYIQYAPTDIRGRLF